MPSRDALPQLRPDQLFIADGGIETALIFGQGLELPCFAAFVLLDNEAGRDALRRYYEPFLALAHEYEVGFILDTPTWRASAAWAAKLGYSAEGLAEANRASSAFVEKLRSEYANERTPIVTCGAVGPRGDGYRADEMMSSVQAERYHSEQIGVFAETTLDMVTAMTLAYADEAVGAVRAASVLELPIAVSFTVETDGRLPSGQQLKHAVEYVDAETDSGAAYFMVNCAHPTHFAGAFDEGGPWLDRVAGIRANASAKSHAELDEADELDPGDPVELAAQYVELRSRLQNLSVVGGCCGTDHRHVREMCRSLCR
jgi:homocysteine S-methyltransferase